jgi:hypothetical protein
VTTPGVLEAKGFQLAGYCDLDGRPAFKLATQRVGDRRYLYMGHFWHAGWSVVDVTDPTAPELVNFIEGPNDTWTLQVQAGDGKLITSLEGPSEGWGIEMGLPYEEGVLIWDVAGDPVKPALLGSWNAGGRGTHRNFYNGGDIAVMAANPEGFVGNIPVIVDLSDPAHPKEISRWWWPGQNEAAGEVAEYDAYLHGPAYWHGNRAYLGYGRVGMVVLDFSDLTKPELVSRISFGDLGGRLGCHSAVPLGDRGLIVANSEAIKEGTGDPLNYAFVVEEQGDDYRIASFLPLPEPSEGLDYASYYDKGGRFGPHNQHHYQNNPDHLDDPNTVFLTYFNAGLRRYDVTDPYVPRETGFFVPTEPAERRGPKPTELVTQFEDVLIDDRGVVFCTDKNHGLFVLQQD